MLFRSPGEPATRLWDDWVRDFSFEDVTLAYAAAAHLSIVLKPSSAAVLFRNSRYSLKQVFLQRSENAIKSFSLATKLAFKGQFKQREFISSGRIDDLSMVHAGVAALFDSDAGKATNVMVAFDNEEVGSITKQGAASPFVKDVLKRVSWALSEKRDAFFRAKISSFGISADNAHAIHPNFPEKHDAVSQPVINKGPVIKYNADQKYTSDAMSSATFAMLCEKADVPFQKYVNRSDIKGGSTLGSILSTQMDIRMVDVGNPMLAMHSIRELAGVEDHLYIKKVFDEFYKS